MTNHAESQRGRPKNRSAPTSNAAKNIRQRLGDEKRDFLERLNRDRAQREQHVQRLRSEKDAALVALARSERARAVEQGKVVAPTIDEYRRGQTLYYTVPGAEASA